MTQFQWVVFFLVVQAIHFLGTWRLYEAAGRKKWEAAIPVYNAIVLLKIIGRPTWWVLLLFIPIINLIIFPVIWIETLRSFGKKTTKDGVLAVATLGLYIGYINYSKNLHHSLDKGIEAVSKVSDTISSLLFAIVVATFVHTYFIQPFTIPTSSLEKSLLVGDFLFVSKFNYGARIPMTTLALPMMHDTIPIPSTKIKSYFSCPQLPYFRLPAIQSIERNDIVVFNWPVDTVYKFRDKSGLRVNKPIDKKSNYVKRCVGLPGDSLHIKDGIIFINGKELILPERAKPQFSYKIALDGKTPIDLEYILRDMDVTDGAGFMDSRDTLFVAALTESNAEKFRNIPGVTAVQKIISKEVEPGIFPHINQWNRDNFGSIYIPKEETTVDLNLKTLPFYRAIITDYENNKLDVKGSEIWINDKVVSTYTFKQNYYWMMGDNRHNSEDSRYWGYVPENHIVGKPIFIWMSWDTNGKGFDKIRWSRLFTTVSGEGQPQSYFKLFLFALAIYLVGDYFWKKRKEAK